MQKALEIYPNKKRSYEYELESIAQWKGSPRNKEVLNGFHNFLFSTGSKELRVTKVSGQLRRIADVLKKDFDIATDKDLQAVVAHYQRQEKYSDDTKKDYLRAIKQFYKWFKLDDKSLEDDDKDIRKAAERKYRLVESLSTVCKPTEADYSNILTDIDIDVIIDKGCKTLKEKAFVKMLHESGARIGEFLNLKIKDIEINENFARVRLFGKTGERRIPLTNSLPYLVQWLDLHQFKGNGESYLWIGDSLRYGHVPILHTGAQKLVDRCMERAGYIKNEYAEVILENGKKRTKLLSHVAKKKHNLHWFRHSRATLLAPQLTEVMLCKYMGWTLGSKQVRRYVHLCTEQLDNAYLAIKGLQDVQKENMQKPQKCGCKTINDANARYCYRCGKPLSVSVVLQDQDAVGVEIDKSVKLLMEIAGNPELMKRFEEFRKNMVK